MATNNVTENRFLKKNCLLHKTEDNSIFHWAVQSRFRTICIYVYVCMSVCQFVYRKPIQKKCMPKCVGGNTWPIHAHAQRQFWVVKTTSNTRIIHFYYTLEQL